MRGADVTQDASVGGFICVALGNLAPARVLSLLIVETALRTAAEWQPVAGCTQRYAEVLPKGPLKLIADAGHFPMLDDPSGFADAVVQATLETRGEHS